MPAMSRGRRKAATVLKASKPFLTAWCEQHLEEYLGEYGGNRAGIRKGGQIPFPPHKIKAALALLSYGAPNNSTLDCIARRSGISNALLRLWRTEERFLGLYREAVWECADDYLPVLADAVKEERAGISDEFTKNFGVALQQCLLCRLWVDILEEEPEWNPIGLKPRERAEWDLVGPPARPLPRISHSREVLRHTAHTLLAAHLQAVRGREPGLARWASEMWLRDLRMKHSISTDLTKAIQAGDMEEVEFLVGYITAPRPLEDWRRLHELLASSEKAPEQQE